MRRPCIVLAGIGLAASLSASAWGQASTATQVVVRHQPRTRWGLGVLAATLSAGPGDRPASGGGLQVRWMTPGVTLSSGLLAYDAADDPGYVNCGNAVDICPVPAAGSGMRIGLFIDASYNVYRHGRYAVFLGSSASGMFNGAGYSGSDNYPRNPAMMVIAGQIGFAHRIGERGGFIIEAEPGFSELNTTLQNDPRSGGFTLQVKTGLFVF